MRRSLVSLLTPTCLALTLIGCTHDLDTPAPQLAGIQPNLACNQQITKAITITGMNLTPLPTKSLGTEVLNLPVVTLTPSANLDGSGASGQPVTLPGSNDDPAGVHVRWESETQMGFDVYPDLMLAPALYDVGVANPDGKSASLPQGLAVVPPPMIGMVMPPNICDAQSAQMIVVNGTNFLGVDQTTPTVTVLDMAGNAVFTTTMTTLANCTPVGMRTPALQECTTLSFTIPEGAIPPGMYVLRVTNPADAECSSTESIPFVVEPPPHIASVLPTHICQGGGTLAVSGTGFMSGASVSLSLGGTSVNGSPVSVNAGGTTANASFGAVPGMPGDQLDVTLQNPDGCKDTLPMAVTVTPGPIIFYVDPPFVFGNITTPVTIYTTGIGTLPATGAVVLTPHGGGAPIDLTSKATVDPQHPKHIILDVPPGLAAGPYDLTVTDNTNCPAFYANAITVVTQSVTLKDIVPPFGYDMSTTDVTIDATAAFFKAGARAYFTKHGSSSSPAVTLQAPVVQSPTQLTAVVPVMGSANDGLWDVVVVNPDGTIGFYDNNNMGAFRVENLPVPVITSISPGGVATNCMGTACNVTIGGQNFNVTGAANPVTLSCALPGMTPMTYNATIAGGTTPSSTSVVITVPAAALAVAGVVCVPTVNNGAAGNDMFATGGTIAIFQSNFNVNAVNAGQPLMVARRAPAVAYNGPTLAARYLYAIGGDNGTLDATSHLPTAEIDSVEFALQDPFTGEKPWALLPDQARLPVPITLAGAASAGNFIYLVGGYSGGALNTVYRAQVLQPGDSPQLNDADLTPDPTNGLAPGLYFYRVAAVLKGSDTTNPGGETLAGDEFAINVPTFLNEKFQITLSWTGGPANVDHWRIYRTSAPGMAPLSEDVVFVTANATSTTFIDKGPTLTPFVAGTPQPFGGLGKWATQPAMNVHRAGAGVTLLVDTNSTGNAYLYAGLGMDDSGGTATFPTTYEALTIATSTGSPSGTWSAATNISNGTTTDTGRWLGGAFAITPDVDSAACPTTGACQDYVAFGPGATTVAAEATTTGLGATGVTNATDIGRVTTGTGALVFGTAVTDNSDKEYGYGSVTATNFLFQIGGTDTGGALNKVNSSQITAAANATSTPTLATYGPQGTGQLTTPVFLPGEVFGPPFFYTIGGSASVGGAATKITYFNVF